MGKGRGVHKSLGRLEGAEGVSLEGAGGGGRCEARALRARASRFFFLCPAARHQQLREESLRVASVDGGNGVGYRKVGDIDAKSLRESEGSRQARADRQSFRTSLFPHMTATENVTCASDTCEGAGARSRASGPRAARAGRSGGKGRKPENTRSCQAGQQQRVAIARRAGDGPQADAVRRAHLRRSITRSSARCFAARGKQLASRWHDDDTWATHEMGFERLRSPTPVRVQWTRRGRRAGPPIRRG